MGIWAVLWSQFLKIMATGGTSQILNYVNNPNTEGVVPSNPSAGALAYPWNNPLGGTVFQWIVSGANRTPSNLVSAVIYASNRSAGNGAASGVPLTVMASNDVPLVFFASDGNQYMKQRVVTTNGFVSFSRNTLTPVTIAVGASPFTFLNDGSAGNAGGTNNINVFIDAGTVSAISLNGTTIFTATGKTVPMQPGETLIVTYSVLPTMTYKPF